MIHPGDALSALVDGELSPDDARAVRRHLDGCDSCRDELRAVTAARAALRALPPLELPERVVTRVRWLNRRRRPRRVAVAAAAAASIAAGLFQTVVPQDDPVSPSVGRLVEVHATSGVGADTVSQLAPAAVPISFEEREP